ncbi:MAG: iron-sulfur cluster assembly scaffold protein [Bacteroidota bacterium]
MSSSEYPASDNSSSKLSLDDLYNRVMVQHVKQPVGTVPISFANAEALSRNESCGDEVSVRLHVEQNQVVEAELQAKGCMICKASASLCAQAIQRRSIEEVRRLVAEVRELVNGMVAQPQAVLWENIDVDDHEAYRVLQAMEAYPTRHNCALMAWNTVGQALDSYGDDSSFGVDQA